eukprot:TRINITY_DN499_c0_g1_i1.p1 TRINITY_DN499_c0_g1~~TRINITY_DN499_c0_g1_i1.p1  ORF type:complete len:261 (-),score=77.49 TRINITY_DN499_c0_g1_i1:62-844(-)
MEIEKRFEIIQLSLFKDNYSFLVVCKKTKETVAVDAAEVSVATEIENRGLNLVALLSTHHHWDHAGGNTKMLEKFPQAKVYGGSKKVQAVTHVVGEGDEITFGDNLKIKVISAYCHTDDHILFYFEDGNNKSLFTGDTLFVGGCGKFFEGTPNDMYVALQKVVKLDKETVIYCGHEYTESNLRFCLSIEPENKFLIEKVEWVKQRRQQNLPTVPSLLSEELSYNVFLRTTEPTVVNGLKVDPKLSPSEVLGLLREAKNKF